LEEQVDTNYGFAKGWLWAYKALRDGEMSVEEVEDSLSDDPSGEFITRQYERGAREAIVDWQEEQKEEHGRV
jgi:hypothetical protein